MRVLVTGASGFLGSECVRHLRAAGHEVITTDKRAGSDLLLDLALPADVRRLPDVEAVVHSAAVQYIADDLPRLARARYFQRNNVLVTRLLADRYTGKDTHFINIGSSMMYEQNGARCYGVDSPWRAQGAYTGSKIAAQQYVDRMPNPKACVLPCIIAGPGRGGLFASIVGTMRRWGVALWPGPGRHPIHLVHVTDAASLIASVVSRGATGRFNAASPEPLSINDWVDEMASALTLGRMRKVMLPLEPIRMASALTGYRLLAREQLLMLRFSHVLDTKESRALGWTPRYTNAEIVRETARALTGAQ